MARKPNHLIAVLAVVSMLIPHFEDHLLNSFTSLNQILKLLLLRIIKSLWFHVKKLIILKKIIIAQRKLANSVSCSQECI